MLINLHINLKNVKFRMNKSSLTLILLGKNYLTLYKLSSSDNKIHLFKSQQKISLSTVFHHQSIKIIQETVKLWFMKFFPNNL